MSQSQSFARHLPTIARFLMGLMFLVFGLNGFLHFIPQPKDAMPEGATAFINALMNTGFMFPLVAGTQVLVGILLLANRFVPLALVLIAPIIVVIVTFHLFLAPTGMVMALVVLALELFLVWSYRRAYHALFTARTSPA
ncbi:MAG: DoxX family membrane protein [Planctomycetes bacterium]|nr:DoxX family membrane protein [Planctomycetota bacterium]